MDGQPASSSPNRDSRVRVLIIEDNALIALDLETQMEDLGCDVVGVAVTAAQAIDTARRTLPDLALVDLQLADGAGPALRTGCGLYNPERKPAQRHRGGTTCDPSPGDAFEAGAPARTGRCRLAVPETPSANEGSVAKPLPVIFMRSPATAVRRSFALSLGLRANCSSRPTVRMRAVPGLRACCGGALLLESYFGDGCGGWI